MKNVIFDKTERGREEIATRVHHLALRLRSLLVMIDGKQGTLELLHKVGGLGLTLGSFAELADGGFIREVATSSVAVAPAPNLPALQPTAMSEVEQILALHAFFNGTIKSALGLRGFSLQLKAERAMTLADFEQLRAPFLAAVLKSKGDEMARSLGARLDQLLPATPLP